MFAIEFNLVWFRIRSNSILLETSFIQELNWCKPNTKLHLLLSWLFRVVQWSNLIMFEHFIVQSKTNELNLSFYSRLGLISPKTPNRYTCITFTSSDNKSKPMNLWQICKIRDFSISLKREWALREKLENFPISYLLSDLTSPKRQIWLHQNDVVYLFLHQIHITCRSSDLFGTCVSTLAIWQ